MLCALEAWFEYMQEPSLAAETSQPASSSEELPDSTKISMDGLANLFQLRQFVGMFLLRTKRNKAQVTLANV